MVLPFSSMLQLKKLLLHMLNSGTECHYILILHWYNIPLAFSFASFTWQNQARYKVYDSRTDQSECVPLCRFCSYVCSLHIYTWSVAIIFYHYYEKACAKKTVNKDYFKRVYFLVFLPYTFFFFFLTKPRSKKSKLKVNFT